MKQNWAKHKISDLDMRPNFSKRKHVTVQASKIRNIPFPAADLWSKTGGKELKQCQSWRMTHVLPPDEWKGRHEWKLGANKKKSGEKTETFFPGVKHQSDDSVSLLLTDSGVMVMGGWKKRRQTMDAFGPGGVREGRRGEGVTAASQRPQGGQGADHWHPRGRPWRGGKVIIINERRLITRCNLINGVGPKRNPHLEATVSHS